MLLLDVGDPTDVSLSPEPFMAAARVIFKPDAVFVCLSVSTLDTQLCRPDLLSDI